MLPTSTVTSAERPARASGRRPAGCPTRCVPGRVARPIHEVPRRVVRGEKREARAGPARDALDLALELPLRVGVDLDLGGLAGAHVAELGLLEVCDEVGDGRDELDDRLTDGDQLAGVDREAERSCRPRGRVTFVYESCNFARSSCAFALSYFAWASAALARASSICASTGALWLELPLRLAHLRERRVAFDCSASASCALACATAARAESNVACALSSACGGTCVRCG